MTDPQFSQSTPDHAADHTPELTPAQIAAVNAAINADWARGWTPPKRAAFLCALARCGIVIDAAEHVGLSSQGAYKLRARDPAFAKAWDAARDQARECVADELFSKALDGWQEEVWYKGEVVGMRRRYDPRLAMRLLARLDRVGGHVGRGGLGRPIPGANHFGEIITAEEADEPTGHLFEAERWQLRDAYDEALRFGDHGRAAHLAERIAALTPPGDDGDDDDAMYLCADESCQPCRDAEAADDDAVIARDDACGGPRGGTPTGCITAAREAEETDDDPEWQAAVAEMDAVRDARFGTLSVQQKGVRRAPAKAGALAAGASHDAPRSGTRSGTCPEHGDAAKCRGVLSLHHSPATPQAAVVSRTPVCQPPASFHPKPPRKAGDSHAEAKRERRGSVRGGSRAAHPLSQN
ncbi:MAG: hypothetical protein ABL882_09615 [Sphingopyxis sp.]